MGLTTHLYLTLRLRMKVVLLLCSQYAFVVPYLDTKSVSFLISYFSVLRLTHAHTYIYVFTVMCCVKCSRSCTYNAMENITFM